MSWRGLGIVKAKRGRILVPQEYLRFSEYKLSIGTDGALILHPHKISDSDKFQWKRLSTYRRSWWSRLWHGKDTSGGVRSPG